MMMASEKMTLILALAVFAGFLGMEVGILAQPTGSVKEKQADEVVADAPLEADGLNQGRAALPQGALTCFGRLPFHNGSRIHASELSPDGKLLATLSSRSATVWDTATGQPVYRFFFDLPARGLVAERSVEGPLHARRQKNADIAQGKPRSAFARDRGEEGSIRSGLAV